MSDATFEDDQLRIARSLEQLDDELAAGELIPADYLSLRDALVAEQDNIRGLRNRDRASSAPSSESPSHQSTSHDSMSHDSTSHHSISRSSHRPVVLVVCILAVAALAGWAVARSSGERLAADQVSGNIDQSSSDKLARAGELSSQGKILDAIKIYDSVLATDPNNVEALAYKGWLLALSSPELTDKALPYLIKAVETDPSYPDAHVFLGITLFRGKGDAARAVPELQAALALPSLPKEMRPLVKSTLDEARTASAAPTASAPTTSSPTTASPTTSGP